MLPPKSQSVVTFVVRGEGVKGGGGGLDLCPGSYCEEISMDSGQGLEKCYLMGLKV